MYLAFHRNYGINVRIGRFHNVYGPEGTYEGGREKAPAALCRKVALAKDGVEIEIWGDGEQTRSFLYIDDALEGVRKFMDSDFLGPLNLGSEELISINNLAKMIMEIAGKNLTIKHIPGPTGVRGRNADLTLARQKIGWEPKTPLRVGIEKTYYWIESELKRQGRI
jgi:nucleoside-diphosphate-sugar epimerase